VTVLRVVVAIFQGQQIIALLSIRKTRKDSLNKRRNNLINVLLRRLNLSNSAKENNTRTTLLSILKAQKTGF